VATVASERGIGSGNIRSRVISNTSGTSPPGSIRCKSLQVGHLRYQLWICPGKSPFWKVPAGQQRPEGHHDARLFHESYQPRSRS